MIRRHAQARSPASSALLATGVFGSQQLKHTAPVQVISSQLSQEILAVSPCTAVSDKARLLEVARYSFQKGLAVQA